MPVYSQQQSEDGIATFPSICLHISQFFCVYPTGNNQGSLIASFNVASSFTYVSSSVVSLQPMREFVSILNWEKYERSSQSVCGAFYFPCSSEVSSYFFDFPRVPSCNNISLQAVMRLWCTCAQEKRTSEGCLRQFLEICVQIVWEKSVPQIMGELFFYVVGEMESFGTCPSKLLRRCENVIRNMASAACFQIISTCELGDDQLCDKSIFYSSLRELQTCKKRGKEPGNSVVLQAVICSHIQGDFDSSYKNKHPVILQPQVITTSVYAVEFDFIIKRMSLL